MKKVKRFRDSNILNIPLAPKVFHLLLAPHLQLF